MRASPEGPPRAVRAIRHYLPPTYPCQMFLKADCPTTLDGPARLGHAEMHEKGQVSSHRPALIAA